MLIYFISNNIHFALELLGALVFLVMSWLSIDAYLINKDSSTLVRGVGFALVAFWQGVYAFNIATDFFNFISFFIYIIGLILIISSFLTKPKLAAVSSFILIPSFSQNVHYLYIISFVLFFVISFLLRCDSKKESGNFLKPLCVGFLFLTIATFLKIFFSGQDSINIFWYVINILECISFLSFSVWVWQYLRLRIKESLILIFLSMTLIISTVITLVFSTVLITQIEQETKNNLLINARVLDLSLQSMVREAQVEAGSISANISLTKAVMDNDIDKLKSLIISSLNESNLGFILVTNNSGVVLFRAHSPFSYGDSLAKERVVEEALIGNKFTTVDSSPGEGFSIRSASPFYKDGKIVGSVVVGFFLDSVMLDKMKKGTGLDASLYWNNKIVSTTVLDFDGKSRLLGFELKDTNIQRKVLLDGSSLVTRVVVKGVPYLASYLPIRDGDKKIIGMLSIAKAQVDIMNISNTTNRLTMIAVTLLILILASPIYVLAKRLIGGVIL